jgi:hypothetical protein
MVGGETGRGAEPQAKRNVPAGGGPRRRALDGGAAGRMLETAEDDPGLLDVAEECAGPLLRREHLVRMHEACDHWIVAHHIASPVRSIRARSGKTCPPCPAFARIAFRSART